MCRSVRGGGFPQSDALRQRSVDLAYNLEFEAADAMVRQAIAVEPDESANHLALASIVWVQMLFRRGALTADEYLGPASLADVARTPPPPASASQLLAALDRAASLAEARLRRNPNDVAALYALGAAAGRRAGYIATEEGRLMAAFRAARRAYDAHERVLALDPTRQEAGLIVGTYRYLVATLSRFKRWLAYLAGFGGDKALAFRLLEECARVPGEVAAEARFALVIMYNREGRYEEAVRELRGLRERYPLNRLLWLETGATLLRAGRPREALGWLDEGIGKLTTDARPRAFGEDAMWHYKRGLALAALGRGHEAGQAATLASSSPAQYWLRGRILTLEGQVADLAGESTSALRAYRRALDIGRASHDPLGVQEAARWIDNPFGELRPVPASETVAMAKKTPWGWIIFGIVAFTMLVGVSLVAVAGFFVYQQFAFKSLPATERTAEDTFEEVAKRFEHQKPLLVIEDGEPVVRNPPTGRKTIPNRRPARDGVGRGRRAGRLAQHSVLADSYDERPPHQVVDRRSGKRRHSTVKDHRRRSRAVRPRPHPAAPKARR